MSPGILGKKIGMTQVFRADGQVVPVTVLKAGPCVVVQRKTPAIDGYDAVQLGLMEYVKKSRINKPATGHFAKAGVTPRRHLTEVRTEDAADYTLGQELAVDICEAGKRVDVVGTSKGKGFAGVMKRHNFKGVSSSHGSHRNHRKPGSIGASSTPSRVFKGWRMAGRMGGERVSAINLTVHAVDLEKNLILVKGAVPGPKGQIVFVRTSVKGA